MNRLAIIGDGAWGRALSRQMVGNGVEVRIVGEGAPPKRPPSGLKYAADLPTALAEHEVLVLAVPIAVLDALLKRAAPHLEGHHRVVTTARGLAPGDVPLRASELVESLTCVRQTAVLAGAADADALAAGHPAALVVGSAFPTFAQDLQRALAGPMLRVYTNDDLTGVELSNSLAAVMAVALGAARAMDAGASTEATALTRALAEMERLVQKLGGRAGTAYGLAGLGVLADHVFRGEGQAFSAGAHLVRGELALARRDTELVDAAGHLAARARSAGVRAPLTEAIAAMFDGSLAAHEALTTLMTRAARAE